MKNQNALRRYRRALLAVALLAPFSALAGAPNDTAANSPAAPGAAAPPPAAVQPPGAGGAPSGLADPESTIAPGVTPGAVKPPDAGGPDSAVSSTADWPCVQRKVETLTSTQIWDGPPVEGVTGWDEDAAIKDLIPVLVSRRIPVEEAAADIKKFAESVPEAERDQKLTILFAGLLAETNKDRAIVVNGIETFQRRQRLRSAELEREGVEIAKLREANASEEALTKATELYNWNARIFQERQNNMPLACEIPVLIEQRIYELGREVRTHMKS